MHKRVQWPLIALLTLFSPVLFALGLGGASVQSYLNQPLDVRVQLISRTSGELQSITAGLASANDFEMLGLSRSVLTVPLEFEVVTDSGAPYIHITSRVAVSEPVVQVLVEVAWANGRMLREYTLFLDPPTFESAAPPVAVKPAPLPAVVKEPPVASKPAVVEPAPRAPEPVLQEPEPVVEEAEPVVEEAEPVVEEAEPVVEEAEPVVEEAEPVVEDSLSEEFAAETTDEVEDGEVYGPVARGETLWGIAREWSRGSGYSINQTMLAMQRKNPDAFIRANINSLKRGAILRLPAYSEVGELSSREAMLEVLRQEEEARTGIRTVAPDYNTPTVADSGGYQESTTETVQEPVIEEDAGHLELVPPAEKDEEPGQVDEQAFSQASTDRSWQEELSRSEEELLNAQQENTYLRDRIEQLETQQQEQALTVTDPGLAAVESGLAEKRAADEPEPPVAVTPGGEEQPWYAGAAWIAGIALVLVAVVIWLLRRRSASQAEAQRAGETHEAVQAVTDEAEDLLRILDRYERSTAAKVNLEAESDPETEKEPETEAEAEPKAEAVQDEDQDAGEAETEEQNPEVKLDLARAYLALGDKEAAKSMLDDVLSSGNEAQRAEAQQMMEEL